MMDDHAPVPWHRIFCERPVEMAALQAAYEAVADPIAPKPQIVALVAESGLGKTRLVQEFYHWLSTVKDGVAGAGYWPDVLERLGDTLEIVPRSGFMPENEMQFIWAGTRLPNPGERNSAPSSKIDSLAADFVPHVQDLYKRRHREKKTREINEAGREAAKEIGIEAAQKIAETAANFVFPFAGLIISLATKTLNVHKLGQEIDSLEIAHPDEHRGKAQNDLSQRFLDDFRDMFDRADKYGQPKPVVLIVDDAQWLESDPGLTYFLTGLINESFKKGWSVLLCVTCWESEWNQNVKIRQLIESVVPAEWQPLVLGEIADLRPMLKAAFADLLDEDSADLILETAGGNPLLLDQLISLLRREPIFHVGDDCAKPLDPRKLGELRAEHLNLHDLVEKRLKAAGDVVRGTLALSSAQGMRFLASLTQDVLDRLGKSWSAEKAIEQAEDPLALVKRRALEATEFRQHVFREVAMRALKFLPGKEFVKDALADALDARLRNQENIDTASNADDLFRIAASFADDSDPKLRSIGARGLALLAKSLVERSELRGAFAAAQAFEARRQAGRFDLRDIDAGPLFSTLDALRNFGPAESAKPLALAILDLRKQVHSEDNDVSTIWLLRALDRVGSLEQECGQLSSAAAAFEAQEELAGRTYASRSSAEFGRQHSVSLGNLGVIAEARGLLDVAGSFFQRALVIDEELARELGTPKSRRDLSVSLSRLGNIAEARGLLDAAESFFQRSLVIFDELAQELGTPNLRGNVSWSFGRLGGIAEARGLLGAAESFFQRALVIDEELAWEFATPNSRLRVSWNLGRLGNIAKARGLLDAAESFFQRALVIYEGLAQEIGMPDSRRGVSASLRRLGGIAEERGLLDAAESFFQRALVIDEGLAQEIDTPNYRRDVSWSLGRLGGIAEARGLLDAAESFFQRALVISEELAQELGTPNSRRDVSVSLFRLGGIAEARGLPDAAESFFQRALVIYEELALELGTPDSRRDVSVSLGRIGGIAEARGLLDAAGSFFQRALVISEQLAQEIKTPNYRRDVSVSLFRLGGIAKERGLLDAAESFFQRALMINEGLAQELGTANSRRDVSVSLFRLGGIAEARGLLDAAESFFQRAFVIVEELARELGTPKSRRDVALSLRRLGGIAEARGQMETAKALFAQALAIDEELATASNISSLSRQG